MKVQENVENLFPISDDIVILSVIRKDEYREYQKILCDNLSSMGRYFFSTNPNYVKELFGDLLKKESFYCTIREKVTHQFCGYCGIKDVDSSRPELAIELIKSMQHKGIGTHALKLLLQTYSLCEEFEYFTYIVAADNYPSQHLCEKIGGIPNRIVAFILKDPQLQEIFEESNLHMINDHLRDVAKKFNVEPKKLLSHFLEYKILPKNK